MKAGYDEIVVVPLLLTEAYHAKVDVPAAIAAASAPSHEGLQIRATPILGLEARFLEVLDVRLREALKAPGCASSTRSCSLPPAPATRSPTRRSPGWPALGLAAQAARHRGVRLGLSPGHRRGGPRLPQEGRRHIAVASLFLAPGFLPDRAAELALEAGAVAVSEPLGAHPEIARTMLARYAVGAVELVPV